MRDHLFYQNYKKRYVNGHILMIITVSIMPTPHLSQNPCFCGFILASLWCCSAVLSCDFLMFLCSELLIYIAFNHTSKANNMVESYLYIRTSEKEC